MSSFGDHGLKDVRTKMSKVTKEPPPSYFALRTTEEIPQKLISFEISSLLSTLTSGSQM
jgi:hypothetical protein